MAITLKNYRRAETWQEMVERCPASGRHEPAPRVAGRMHYEGLDAEFIAKVIYEMLLAAGRAEFDPKYGPLASEVRSIVEYVSNGESGGVKIG